MKRSLRILIAMLMVTAGLTLTAQAPTAGQAQAATSPAPAMRYWFVRLIPPRPTFAQDITPDEQAAMNAHFVYWKEKYDRGVLLVGGPVLDAKGVFGILIIQAANEDEARMLAEGDPSVKAKVNRVEMGELKIAFFQKPKTQ